MQNPFRYFNSSPEVIRLAVMMYVRYPLSLRQVEDRHCQTNWMGPVEPTIEGSQTASWRHSAKAAERLSLKLPRL